MQEKKPDILGKNLKKNNKLLKWETPEAIKESFSETKSGGKISVPGEPNPFGFGYYGS